LKLKTTKRFVKPSGVFGRRFASSGAPQGTEFQVNTYTKNYQDQPALCCAADGSFVVTWADDGQDGDDEGIFGRRFSSSGAAQGSEFQVNTYTTGSQEDPSLCCAGDGAFVVVWESEFQDGNFYGITGRRFSSSGAAQGNEFQVNSYTVDQQDDPDICCDAAGFVVTWSGGYQLNQDGDGEGIFARRFSAAGAPQGVDFQVNSYTTGPQDRPALACGSDGKVLVAWEGGGDGDDQDGSNEGVFARLLGVPQSVVGAPALRAGGLAALAGLLVLGGAVVRRRRAARLRRSA
jgi:hypothetical protein